MADDWQKFQPDTTSLSEEEVRELFLPSEAELAIADEKIGILVLVQGHRTNGNPFYAYVVIPPSKYAAFKEAEARGNYKLSEYGDIIRRGDTLDPPQHVIDEMAEEFGANPDFEQELQNAAQQAYDKATLRERIKNKYNV